MSSGDLPRVFFSANDRANINRYGLRLLTSLSDLERLGTQLRDGLRVVIYEPGKLEMQATLAFDPDFDAWVATGGEETIVYLPGSGGEHLNA